MDRIAKMDRRLSDALLPIESILSQIPLSSPITLDEFAADGGLNFAGIYLIEVRVSSQSKDFQAWVDLMRAEWGAEKHGKKFTPTLKKMRLSKHSRLYEWMPLYLGKAKNIGKRIREHAYLPLETSTYALKLRARGFEDLTQFRVRVLELRVTNYDIISAAFEAGLRNRLNPVVGKQ